MTDTKNGPTVNDAPPGLATPAGVKRAPVEWKKPSMLTKLAFATPSFASSFSMSPMTTELKIFYTDTLLVPAGLLALVTAISRAFDALTDPLMAWISDNVKTRWGRRKPYILPGVILSGLCYWALFAPPQSLTSMTSIAIWAGLAYGFFFLFNTVYMIPYHALGLELTPDYDDRTSVFGIRSICGAIGSISGFFFLSWIHPHMDVFGFVDIRHMLFALAGYLAIQKMVFYSLPVIAVKEHPEFSRRKGSPLVPGFRRAIRNGPFKLMLTVMIISSVSISIPPLLMPYFSKHVLHLPAQYRNIFALIYVGAGFIGIPAWMRLSRKFGKLAIWVVTAISAGTCGGIFWFVREGMIKTMGVLEFIRGFSGAAHQLIMPALLADVIDYDELQTGKRREAQFGVFLGMLPKFVSIFAATVPLAILGVSGYNASTMTSMPDSAILAIRSLFSWFPLTFHAIILIIILRYPISKTVHQQIREGVMHHQQGLDAVDPITGKTLPPRDMQAVDEETGWFLDNFSIKELKAIIESGTESLLNRVKIPIVRAGIICFGAIVTTIWLLSGSMSISQADQAKQGIATFFIVVAGLSFTLMVFHILRIRPAKKMMAEPVGIETIKEHLKTV